MNMQLLRAGMAVALFGMGHAVSAAEATLLHFGSVTLVGTLYTDATRHVYLRLDQPITVASDLPSDRRSSGLIDQQEVDVAALVFSRPVNGVRMSLTGQLEHGVTGSRALMLAVQASQDLP